MTVRTRAQLNSDADANLADNEAGDISALDARQLVKDLADSARLPEDLGGGYQTGGTWYVLGASAVAASHTGDLIETTLATVTVPGGAMGPNGILRITTLWSYTSSANIKTMRVKLDGTNFLNVVPTTSSAAQLLTMIRNRNAQNSQIGYRAVDPTSVGTSSGALPTGVKDTSINKDVTFHALLADAGETITLEAYLVELFYKA
jgi:hypothetical protein